MPPVRKLGSAARIGGPDRRPGSAAESMAGVGRPPALAGGQTTATGKRSPFFMPVRYVKMAEIRFARPARLLLCDLSSRFGS